MISKHHYVTEPDLNVLNVMMYNDYFSRIKLRTRSQTFLRFLLQLQSVWRSLLDLLTGFFVLCRGTHTHTLICAFTNTLKQLVINDGAVTPLFHLNRLFTPALFSLLSWSMLQIIIIICLVRLKIAEFSETRGLKCSATIWEQVSA